MALQDPQEAITFFCSGTVQFPSNLPDTAELVAEQNGIPAVKADVPTLTIKEPGGIVRTTRIADVPAVFVPDGEFSNWDTGTWYLGPNVSQLIGRPAVRGIAFVDEDAKVFNTFPDQVASVGLTASESSTVARCCP